MMIAEGTSCHLSVLRRTPGVRLLGSNCWGQTDGVRTLVSEVGYCLRCLLSHMRVVMCFSVAL